MAAETACALDLELWAEAPLWLAGAWSEGLERGYLMRARAGGGARDSAGSSFVSGTMAIDVVRSREPDWLDPLSTRRLIERVLTPMLHALDGVGAPLAGVFVGAPRWGPFVEPWSARLEAALRGEGWDDSAPWLRALFADGGAGKPRSFAFAYRRATARALTETLARPLACWARNAGARLAGPPEFAGDSFPAWIFGDVGADRSVPAPCGLDPSVAMRGARIRSPGGALVSIFAPGAIGGAEAMRLAGEAAIWAGAERAILDWLPVGRGGETSPFGAASLYLSLPDLHGLRSLAGRLATAAAVRQSARRSVEILALSSRASFWCFPRLEGQPSPANPEAAAREDAAALAARLGDAFARFDALARAFSVECDLWDERLSGGGWARAAEGRLLLGDRSYSTVVIPAALNLESETLRLLREFQAGGGAVLALAPTLSLLDGAPNREVLEWARSSVEAHPTPESLIARLLERHPGPLRMGPLGGLRRLPIEAIWRRDSSGAWIALRNPSPAAPARARLEIRGVGRGFRLAPWRLDNGQPEERPALASAFAGEMAAEIELAPAETRLLRCARAEAALQAAPVSLEIPLAEARISSDWKVELLDDNIFPLTHFEWMPLDGSGEWREIAPGESAGRAMRRFAAAREPWTPIELALRFRFGLSGLPPFGLGDGFPLALRFPEDLQVQAVLLNGRAGRSALGAPSPFPGLAEQPLPAVAQEGENTLEVRLLWSEREQRIAGTERAWLLAGRAQGPWVLMARPGRAQLLAALTMAHMNAARAIHDLDAGGGWRSLKLAKPNQGLISLLSAAQADEAAIERLRALYDDDERFEEALASVMSGGGRGATGVVRLAALAAVWSATGAGRDRPAVFRRADRADRSVRHSRIRPSCGPLAPGGPGP